MPVLDLSFASGESSLSVRRFSVREAVSTPFTISVWACSKSATLDLPGLVGRGASLRIESGYAHAHADARRWTGVCSYIEQTQPEPTGLSTYHLRIVPSLWLLGHRRNHRIFQHLSIPDIVDALLSEWSIEHRWEIDRPAYPRLEYKVQYGESDYAFLSRLLEEAGIAFTMADGSTLVLGDALHGHAPRGAALRYVDEPSLAAEREYISRVELSHEVRPGAHVLRDHDFSRAAHRALRRGLPRAREAARAVPLRAGQLPRRGRQGRRHARGRRQRAPRAAIHARAASGPSAPSRATALAASASAS